MEELAKLEEERREAAGVPNGMMKMCGQSGKKDRYKRVRHTVRDRAVVPQGVASNEMCTFLIINISSLQLIPVNMIANRCQYWNVNPAAIAGPGIVGGGGTLCIEANDDGVLMKKRKTKNLRYHENK